MKSLKSQKQITFGIDYDEPDQNTYRGVTLSVKNVGADYDTRKEHRFNCGFPPLDFIDANNFVIEKIGVENILTCMMSSSMDHFTMDGDKYGWKTDEDGSEWIIATSKFKKTKEFKAIMEKIKAENPDCR